MLIYKIFRSPEWAEFRDRGKSQGAPIDLADGYIHFSTGAQVGETCQKYFSDARGLVLLALDAENLGHDLKWEPSRGGALFAHLYRALRIEDVLWHADLPLGADRHVFPDGVL
ncbi:DUF952 domain-containing protein [Rhodobacteraceae bacterium R_SAG10]|jgi:uncharacterized protein (DUF952 family)|nr:DUF952 domain-containing protein [Rhodobacteraceae bacterium R_SAG10]